jgi:hypothetical protein
MVAPTLPNSSTSASRVSSNSHAFLSFEVSGNWLGGRPFDNEWEQTLPHPILLPLKHTNVGNAGRNPDLLERAYIIWHDQQGA